MVLGAAGGREFDYGAAARVYNNEPRLARSRSSEAKYIVSEVKGEPVNIFSAIGGALVTEAKGNIIKELVASSR